MKERPILFSGVMVKAILSGEKIQTRRIVKPQPVANHRGKFKFAAFTDDEGVEAYWQNYPLWGPVRCPYGKPGDSLWVRETFRQAYPETSFSKGIVYRADKLKACGMDEYSDRHKWKPSIFMPRWASRITLEITGVRVERLQDISPDDAIAEGMKGITKDGRLVKYGIPDSDGYPGTDDTGWPWEEWRISPVDAYQKLWVSINGPFSWDANPFCWVIEFKRVTP